MDARESRVKLQTVSKKNDRYYGPGDLALTNTLYEAKARMDTEENKILSAYQVCAYIKTSSCHDAQNHAYRKHPLMPFQSLFKGTFQDFVLTVRYATMMATNDAAKYWLTHGSTPPPAADPVPERASSPVLSPATSLQHCWGFFLGRKTQQRGRGHTARGDRHRLDRHQCI